MVEVFARIAKKYSGKINTGNFRYYISFLIPNEMRNLFINTMNKLLYSLIFFLAVSVLSCRDYDNFSTSPNDTLAFSVDTLSFDTLFANNQFPIGSTTKNFKIYNRHEKPLLISSVRFQYGDRGFRMNIPPENRDENGNFINVRINPQDSLHVFVEATLRENSTNTPQLQEDVIIFTTNGVQQKVFLEAFGQDVFVWRNKIFDESTTLSNEKPYLVFDSIVVNKGVTLKIQEGTTFFMRNNSWFKVEGNIKAKGTLQRPIVFRGHRTDNLFENLPYDRLPGQWDGIWFATSSYNNEFEYVNIRNGLAAMVFELSENSDLLKLKLKNSVLTNMSDHILSAENCNIVVENSELSNAAEALLYLIGGKYSFTHCTFANYLTSINNISSSGQTVAIFNYTLDKDNNRKPLPVAADFFNSIIYSSNTTAGEFLLYTDSDNSGTPINYKFQNCLLLKKDTLNIDKMNFIDCIFNKEPKFVKSTAWNAEKTDYDFIYDFRLDSISPARSKADVTIAKKLPYDLNNISRFDDEGPDIGAYQWTNTETK